MQLWQQRPHQDSNIFLHTIFKLEPDFLSVVINGTVGL
jgi:hypothetical protein